MKTGDPLRIGRTSLGLLLFLLCVLWDFRVDDPFLWGQWPLHVSEPKVCRWTLVAKDICFPNGFVGYFFRLGQSSLPRACMISSAWESKRALPQVSVLTDRIKGPCTGPCVAKPQIPCTDPEGRWSPVRAVDWLVEYPFVCLATVPTLAV